MWKPCKAREAAGLLEVQAACASAGPTELTNTTEDLVGRVLAPSRNVASTEIRVVCGKSKQPAGQTKRRPYKNNRGLASEEALEVVGAGGLEFD